LSSAILYLAIVAIWACVLVPRWLHRSHDSTSDAEISADQAEAADHAEPSDAAEFAAPAKADAGVTAEEIPAPAAAPAEPESVTYSAARADPDASAHGGRPPARRPAPGGPAHPPSPSASRAHVLQARRRMLTMLVALAGVATACVLLNLTAWWTAIPPIGMLVIYALLLREAAHADTESLRRAEAHARARMARAARERARLARERAAAAQAPQPAAEVIDISDRTAQAADQLYDQYADATVRAVGD
jgi:hypothetical protein